MGGFLSLFRMFTMGGSAYVRNRAEYKRRIVSARPDIPDDIASKAAAKAALREMMPLPESKEGLLDVVRFLFKVCFVIYISCMVFAALFVWILSVLNHAN